VRTCKAELKLEWNNGDHTTSSVNGSPLEVVAWLIQNTDLLTQSYLDVWRKMEQERITLKRLENVLGASSKQIANAIVEARTDKSK
jgi:hypothetical protein